MTIDNKLIQKFIAFVLSNEKQGSTKSTISFKAPGSYLFKEEGYKYEVVEKMRARLNVSKWRENDIGTGKIKKSFISAKNGIYSNLVDHHQMILMDNILKDDKKTEVVEAALYGIYREKNPEKTFEQACKVFGRRYDLISYLFFIKDKESYLPLRPTKFEEGLSYLGIDFSMSDKCSWDNYISFINIIKEIRTELSRKLPVKEEISLLDAHSFVWILRELKFINFDSTSQNGQKQITHADEIMLENSREYVLSETDEIYYRIHKDIIEGLFHTKGRIQTGLNPINKNYSVWYVSITDNPDSVPDDKWINYYSDNKEVIYECGYQKRPHTGGIEPFCRITFENVPKKGYRFIGVYKMISNDSDKYRKCRYVKVADHINVKDVNRGAGIVKDIEEIEALYQNPDIANTEKEVLGKARIGQGEFRNRLLKIHGEKCQICGLNHKELLRASHIKEWSKSSTEERVDPANGLLLCALHDALFDQHFISFDSNGKIVISKCLSGEDVQKCNIDSSFRLKMPTKTKEYMKYHRANLRVI